MKEAYIKLDVNGKPWIACPYCNKRAFPLGEDTKIKNLQIRCKANTCKKIFVVNV